MADNNVKTQRHLQSIKEHIFELHVVQGKSINECHRVLVHHKDPWFSYSQLVHAVNRWKQLDPLRWNPSSAAAASGPGAGRPSMSQHPGRPTNNNEPQQIPNTNQALANRHMSAPVMPMSNRSAAPQFLSDQMSWLRAGGIGVGQTMAQHPHYPQQQIPSAMLSNAQLLHNLNNPDEDDSCPDCLGNGCAWCPQGTLNSYHETL